MDKKLDSKVKSSTKSNTTKPTMVKKSTTASKPVSTSKPVSSAKQTTVKSATKPSTTNKSSVASKPVSVKKPTTANTTVTVKKTATAKPVTTTKAVSATKPANTVKTATTTKLSSSSTNKPVSAVKPTTTTKTTVASKTMTTAKSTVAVKTAGNTTTKSAVVNKSTSTTNTTKKATSVAKSTNKQNSSSKSSQKWDMSSFFKNKKVRIIGSSILAFILVFSITLGTILGLAKKDSNKLFILPSQNVATDRPVSKESSLLSIPNVDNSVLESAVKFEYPGTTIVGYYGEITNKNVERNKPVAETRNEGLSKYPTYGYNMNGTTAEKDAVIRESSYLTATGTSNAGGGGYTWMDENGYLYSGVRHANESENTPALDASDNQRQLYKHSASVGLYRGNVSDDEPGVEKVVTMRPRGYNGYSVTGIYAPAGEVITIKMSGADMDATGGIVIHIGQALYNGQANNIWSGKNMPRIAHLLNTMQVNKNTAIYDEQKDEWTAYVGSFIGGPLYIRNESATFTATISGGVEYLHFILGYTTKEEFNRLKENCSAPYFDLEVWNYGVLHSGSRIYANNFSYDDLYKAAVLWEKVSSVTTTGSNQGIVFLYEPFVAAGAAVAFPGRRSVNCPEGWMSNSLNYNTIVTSGAWGNFHEYHHNFQGYGVGNGGEVTNNAMTLVSYALFTKISSKRGISSYGAQGLGGWNNYTSATWALEETLKIARPNESPSNGNQGLALYATLLHNFGPNNFIQAKVAGGGQSYAAYMNAWQKVTHNNMYYYFNNILKGTGISNTETDYPMFVPVSCVYQTGRSYMYDGEKRYFQTMQPYVISHDKPFTIDLTEYNAPSGQYASGSIVIPEGFSYKVKHVTKPEHGTIELVDNKTIIYNPDDNDSSKTSGQIIVTLEITKNDKAFVVDDVDLVLEFELSREMNKMVLERTIYSYSEENMYTDAQVAFENRFMGYEGEPEEYDHANPTQNANTDIWHYPDTPANREKYPDVPEYYFIHDNQIEVIDGKLYFDGDGKYRVYLRGRTNCALYFSLDGENYALGAKITEESPAAPSNKTYLFRPGDDNTYFDIEFSEGNVIVTVYIGDGKTINYKISPNIKGEIENWLYIKEVLIVQKSSNSFIGVGMRQWSQTMFTMESHYYNAQNEEVESQDSEGYQYTETIYNDYNGHQVAVEVSNKNGTTHYYKIVNNQRVETTQDEVTDLTESRLIEPTVTEKSQPYVNAYRCSYEFPDNSAFESDYFYKRSYGYTYSTDITGLTQSCVGESPCADNLPIENLFDDDPSTVCASKDLVSAQAPWILTIDLGKVIEANRFELTGNLFNSAKNQTPNSITLLLGETLDDMKEVISFDNGKVDGIMLKFNFETTRFRYYKLIVRRTVEGRYAAIGNIKFINNITNGTQISPTNDYLIFSGDWEVKQSFSTFGHVYEGEKGATLTFDINGSRLGIFNSAISDPNFEVYIDGVKVDSIDLKEDNGYCKLTYLCDSLKVGKHSVKLVCTDKTVIDSIVVFQ